MKPSKYDRECVCMCMCMCTLAFACVHDKCTEYEIQVHTTQASRLTSEVSDLSHRIFARSPPSVFSRANSNT